MGIAFSSRVLDVQKALLRCWTGLFCPSNLWFSCSHAPANHDGAGLFVGCEIPEMRCGGSIAVTGSTVSLRIWGLKNVERIRELRNIIWPAMRIPLSGISVRTHAEWFILKWHHWKKNSIHSTMSQNNLALNNFLTTLGVRISTVVFFHFRRHHEALFYTYVIFQ